MVLGLLKLEGVAFSKESINSNGVPLMERFSELIVEALSRKEVEHERDHKQDQ